MFILPSVSTFLSVFFFFICLSSWASSLYPVFTKTFRLILFSFSLNTVLLLFNSVSSVSPRTPNIVMNKPYREKRGLKHHITWWRWHSQVPYVVCGSLSCCLRHNVGVSLYHIRYSFFFCISSYEIHLLFLFCWYATETQTGIGEICQWYFEEGIKYISLTVFLVRRNGTENRH